MEPALRHKNTLFTTDDMRIKDMRTERGGNTCTHSLLDCKEAKGGECGSYCPALYKEKRLEELKA